MFQTCKISAHDGFETIVLKECDDLLSLPLIHDEELLSIMPFLCCEWNNNEIECEDQLFLTDICTQKPSKQAILLDTFGQKPLWKGLKLVNIARK